MIVYSEQKAKKQANKNVNKSNHVVVESNKCFYNLRHRILSLTMTLTATHNES